MTLREEFDANATHRVFVGPGVTGEQEMRAENALVRALCGDATEARVAADWNDLSAPAESFREPATPALVEDGERAVSLPTDAAALDALLESTTTGDGHERVWSIRALAVLAGDGPRYHTIPHEPHVRDVFATPGTLEAARGALDSFDGVAVFQTGPLVAWTADGTDCVLSADTFAVDGQAWQLERLVRVTGRGDELHLEWRSASETASDVLQRVAGRVYDALSDAPPGRVAVPDAETQEEVLETVASLRGALGYDVSLD